jgi:diphosphomevalonate decarboxylase
MSEGIVKWSSPSNIAIVKYWGKYGIQLPRNPSISFTLSESKSITTLKYMPKKVAGNSVSFVFEGRENVKFAEKAKLFFNTISQYQPWIMDFDYEIESENTFPHSSGVASSASGMSALAMCILDVGKKLGLYEKSEQLALIEASHFARLGSGSACRSVYPMMAMWGLHTDYHSSSNLHAIGVSDDIHPIFKSYHNDILIVSKTEKSVSSTAGHKLMDTNPYASTRYQQANDHMTRIKSILKAGEIHDFGKIAETEALVLHALMMASDPSFILLEPSSLQVIKQIRTFRSDTNLPIYFTIDAGPNIHVLYPEEHKIAIQNFINSDLKQCCHEGLIIHDRVGNGPEKLI